MNYTWTHRPDPTTLRRDLVTTQAALTVSPTFAATCANTAAEFRALAQWFYDDGDVGRGDRLTARALCWELCGESGNLADVRP